MAHPVETFNHQCVAPRAGAWIEICYEGSGRHRRIQSLPVRERGLKYVVLNAEGVERFVAPRAGAWIEMWSAYLR